MYDPQDTTSPGEISAKDLEGRARLEQLSPLITKENIHDGSETSREYSRLAVEILSTPQAIYGARRSPLVNFTYWRTANLEFEVTLVWLLTGTKWH